MIKLTKIKELPPFHLKTEGEKWIGSQVPTPNFTVPINGIIYVGFTARNTQNKSTCFSYLLYTNNFSMGSMPTYPEMEAFSFFPSGFMLNQINNERVLFTGWDCRDGMKVCCGVVENGKASPLITTNEVATSGSSTPFEYKDDIYYTSWNNIYADETYASYDIASLKEKRIIIKRLEHEGGIGRPIRFDTKNNSYIMFSARGKTGFRTDRTQSYKLWIATLKDGEWIRDKKALEVKGDEDSFLQAYGYPIKIKDKWYVFYNSGNVAKESAISIAELEEV